VEAIQAQAHFIFAAVVKIDGPGRLIESLLVLPAFVAFGEVQVQGPEMEVLGVSRPTDFFVPRVGAVSIPNNESMTHLRA
jgi:hypothetical protein